MKVRKSAVSGMFYAGTAKELEEQIAEIGRLIQALINSLERKSNNQQLKTKNFQGGFDENG